MSCFCADPGSRPADRSGRHYTKFRSRRWTGTPVQVSTGKAGKAIKVGKQPDAIAITPTEPPRTLRAIGTVALITLATGKAGKAIKAGSDPVAIAISINGTVLYVADYGSAKARGPVVTPIALTTDKPGKATTVGSGPDAIVLTPGGLFAFVADYYSGTVTPVRPSTAVADSPLKVGRRPTSIAVTP